MLRKREREEARKAWRRFDKAIRPYVQSEAVDLSLKEGFFAVKEPERVLNKIRQRQVLANEVRKQQEEHEKIKGIPKKLLEVVLMQEKSGKWPVENSILEEILGSGHGIPDPPQGISKWKWMVCLCLVFLRRFPDHYEFTMNAYDRGLYHISDDTLLHKAKAMLPPDNVEIKLDPEYVRKGKWKDSMNLQFAENGYELFQKPKTDIVVTTKKEEQKKIDKAVARLEEKEIKSRLWQANTLRDIGLSKIRASSMVDFKHGHLTAVLNARSALEESLPIYSELADQLNQENEELLSEIFPNPDMEFGVVSQSDLPSKTSLESRNIQDQQQDNEETKTSEVLMKETDEEARTIFQTMIKTGTISKDRLVTMLASHESKLAEEYDILVRRERLGPIGASKEATRRWMTPLPLRKELKRLEAATKPVPKPDWDKTLTMVRPSSRKKKTMEFVSTERKARDMEDHATNEQEEEMTTVSAQANRRTTLQLKLKMQRLRDEVDRKASTVIKRLRAFEQTLQNVQALAKSSVNKYQTAKLTMDKNHAFDPLTQELCKLRLAICSLTEGIQQWRDARNELATELNEDHEPQAYQFYWDGANPLLKIPTCIDFLAGYNDLREWYGRELPLKENPYMLAIPFKNRPASPRSAKRTVLIDGKPVLRISEELAKQREVEVAHLESCWNQICSGPKWWPDCPQDLWYRVRNSEKVLLGELKTHMESKSIFSTLNYKK